MREKIHFIDNELINPTNPITINLIGAGGTGSQVITALARMDTALIGLGQAGLDVTLWDDDVITQANLGRQLFAESELGYYKSDILINRINRFFGTNWKSKTEKYTIKNADNKSHIYISCVDNVKTRFEIAEILKKYSSSKYEFIRPLYWLDFGNSQNIGQVILSTIDEISQPNSKKYETIGKLDFITDQYADLLKHSEEMDDTPSCSLAEALEKQDLFINSSLAQLGISLLWQFFKQGYIDKRGFFLNLENFKMNPLPL